MRQQWHNGLLGFAAWVGVLSFSVSCGEQRPQATLTPAESARAVEVLTVWFQCDECEAGELAAVRRYGESAVPSLIAVLEGGLSPVAREQLRLDLGDRYDVLVQRARTHPNARPTSGKQEFVEMYLANRDAQYRVRAAQALGAIGGARARTALRAALEKPQRNDVQVAVRGALARLN